MKKKYIYTEKGEHTAREKGFFDRKAGTIARFAGEILEGGPIARAWIAAGFIKEKEIKKGVTV